MAKRSQKRKAAPKRPDGRTKAGKAFLRRSRAAKKGWETRRLKEQEPFPEEIYDTGEWIIEQPIETVGGKRYRKKGR